MDQYDPKPRLLRKPFGPLPQKLRIDPIWGFPGVCFWGASLGSWNHGGTLPLHEIQPSMKAKCSMPGRLPICVNQSGWTFPSLWTVYFLRRPSEWHTEKLWTFFGPSTRGFCGTAPRVLATGSGFLSGRLWSAGSPAQSWHPAALKNNG